MKIWNVLRNSYPLPILASFVRAALPAPGAAALPFPPESSLLVVSSKSVVFVFNELYILDIMRR